MNIRTSIVFIFMLISTWSSSVLCCCCCIADNTIFEPLLYCWCIKEGRLSFCCYWHNIKLVLCFLRGNKMDHHCRAPNCLFSETSSHRLASITRQVCQALDLMLKWCTCSSNRCNWPQAFQQWGSTLTPWFSLLIFVHFNTHLSSFRI